METQFILIVENGLVDRRMLSDALQQTGFYLRFASDTTAALEILTKTKPFLILIGVVLAKLDSCTFARILKNDVDTSSMKIIALTHETPDYKRMVYCGFDGFLNMTSNKKSFATEIKRILNIE